MTERELVARAQQCRASTQTDSLTVVLDLSETSPEAVQALEHALRLPAELDGSPIPEQAPKYFAHRCRAAWLALSSAILL